MCQTYRVFVVCGSSTECLDCVWKLDFLFTKSVRYRDLSTWGRLCDSLYLAQSWRMFDPKYQAPRQSSEDINPSRAESLKCREVCRNWQIRVGQRMRCIAASLGSPHPTQSSIGLRQLTATQVRPASPQPFIPIPAQRRSRLLDVRCPRPTGAT